MPKIEKSGRKHIKYVAILPDGKRVNFGDCRYQQFKDQTPLKAYKSADPAGPRRWEAYYARHGKEAPKYSANWLSHKYLRGG